jgi:hypothetical protein
MDSPSSPQMVSRVHASIQKILDGNILKYVLNDEKSLNGCIVNYKRVQQIVLKDGDIVIFGGAGDSYVDGFVSSPNSELIYRFVLPSKTQNSQENSQENSPKPENNSIIQQKENISNLDNIPEEIFPKYSPIENPRMIIRDNSSKNNSQENSIFPIPLNLEISEDIIPQSFMKIIPKENLRNSLSKSSNILPLVESNSLLSPENPPLESNLVMKKPPKQNVVESFMKFDMEDSGTQINLMNLLTAASQTDTSQSILSPEKSSRKLKRKNGAEKNKDKIQKKHQKR